MPSVGGMQEHGAGAFGDVANTPLCHPILVVGTDPTEGDGLLCLADVIHDGTIRKTAIVTIVMPDVYGMLFSDTFKGMFRIKGFLSGDGLVQVHICKAAHMVSEHTGAMVAAGCWLAPCDRDKTSYW